MQDEQKIGYLFPSGGPVPPGLVIGREDILAELERRVDEGIHTMLTGPRRIGKTTVCNAVCDHLSEEGSLVVKVEVPESANAEVLLQAVVDCSRQQASLLDVGGRMLRAAQPLLEVILKEQGLPLDLSQLRRPSADTARRVLALPLRLAEKCSRPTIFYLDELQRVVDYADGEHLLGDLIDLYSGQSDAVLLVDGSSERTLEQMMAPPIGFGKVVDRLPLAEKIPERVWRESLPDRFKRANLEVDPEALAALNSFGGGRPYATMTAARYAALNARKLGSGSVGIFEMTEGIAEARRHLAEDEA
ncbi:MAG TPA: ATP-binding protein [Solirubrobacterales bacterium]|nr:ATP-binding protein [Solirubrobacterales bacterium]